MIRPVRLLAASSTVLLLVTGLAIAQQLTVDLNRIPDSGVGDKIGTVVVSEGNGGVSFKVAVTGVPRASAGFTSTRKATAAPRSRTAR